MNERPRRLQRGWYPDTRKEADAVFAAWDAESGTVVRAARAAIAPHAGWYYSGATAWSTWKRAMDSDCVIIVGGHLGRGSRFALWPEDAFETPYGSIPCDKELRAYIASRCTAVCDTSSDNTIEVHLPMAAKRFAQTPLVCVRAPNDERAAQLGIAAAEYAEKKGLRIFMLASTDMTHYGSAYGYEPCGKGNVAWARRADAALAEAFMALDENAALRRAEKDGSACSVGAALAAIIYAKRIGAVRPELLALTSSDKLVPDAGRDASVGYCSVIYC